MATIKLAVPVTIDHGAVTTVLSAERKIRELFSVLRWYGPEHPQADDWVTGIRNCAEAVEATTGESPAALIERLSPAIERTWNAMVARSEKNWKRISAGQPHMVELAEFWGIVDQRNF